MARWDSVELARLLEQDPPTPEQRAVIEAPLEPQLVIAGAGSGKTATMASRVVYLVANGLVAPEQILGLTFTRKAAAELADRVRRRLRTVRRLDPALDLSDQPRISTYNSYAAGIVTDHALRAGIDPDATLIGEAGRYQLASEVVLGWADPLTTGAAASTLVTAVTALSAELAEHGLEVAAARDHLHELAESLAEKEPEGRRRAPLAPVRDLIVSLGERAEILSLVEAYQRLKAERGVIDFGDQVRLAATIAQRVPAVGAAERDHYRVVLLDEYQDTSIAQVQLLRALFAGGHAVTAVGDPNQAIYGWRGAAAGTLLDFPRAFPRADGSAAPIATLSTAWRNAEAILDVANRLAAPLRSDPAHPALAGAVPPLRPRPEAPAGRVHARYLETGEDEAATITAFLTDLGWGRAAPGAGAPPTAAVLCRKRAFFPKITAALAAAGIPFQVGGLGGLLDTPEVNDVWAALQVAADPARGDVLMRLLTGPAVGLGAADLMALSHWSKEQERRTGRGRRDLEDVEEASIVEAIDHLPPPEWVSSAGLVLSEPARLRLTELAGRLRTIRSLAHLPLPELVFATERLLGLDIEVLAQASGHASWLARINLDEFAAVAANFQLSATDVGPGRGGSLTAFLTWLDLAHELEDGLARAEVEPDPRAVQVMTIHASKGLEWDAVAVAGLNEKDFPTTGPNKAGDRVASGWLTDREALPYELRGDSDHLPALDAEAAVSHPEMADLLARFRHEEGERLVREDRRLAYVALTRARDHLLLSGSFWSGRTTVNTPSLFLGEAVRAGADTGGPWPAASIHESDPATAEATEAPWPGPEPEPVRLDLDDGPVPADARIDALREEAALLLAERDATHLDEVAGPAHLSASAVVRLAQDAAAFERNRRRPIPREPSSHARRGTTFHAWVERYFGASSLLDWEHLPGADDETADAVDAADAAEGVAGADGSDTAGPVAGTGIDELVEAFHRSTWADRRPIRVEVDLHTPLGGRILRSRIDAVFRDEDGVDHIVDWKTGSPARTPEEQEARDLQLAVYRIAWARSQDKPIEQVRASYHYVAANHTVEGGDLREDAVLEVLDRLDPADPPTRRAGDQAEV